MNDYSVDLPDATKRETWRVIHEISAALSLEHVLAMRRHDLFDVTLVSGAAGIALFHHYYGIAIQSAEAAETCFRLVEASLEHLAESAPAPWLYGGYSGVAWVIAHLQQCDPDTFADVDLAEIDDLVLDVVGEAVWRHDFDLLQGVVGLGVYGLERWRRGYGESIVATVVDRLYELAEVTPDGVTWFTPPWLLSREVVEHHPTGWYDLGVAHGVPGVLGFLSRAITAGIATDKAGQLLQGCMRWLRSHVRTDTYGDYIPYQLKPDIRPTDERERARAAWCYGAPGVGHVLLGMRDLPGGASHRELGLSLAMSAAAAPESTARVSDASLCHGSAGLVHQYGRLHRKTGVKVFANATRFWVEQTLQRQEKGTGIAGYSFRTMPNGTVTWLANSGFLEGAAGIGLALLSVVCDIPPTWDRILLSDDGEACTLSRPSAVLEYVRGADASADGALR